LAALDAKQEQAEQQAQAEVKTTKEQLAQVESKLQKSLDVYLKNALTKEEYAAKKQELITRKVELEEKINDSEHKGMSWFEPARGFVLSLNQAAKIVETENKKK